jgi:hypothetical protein
MIRLWVVETKAKQTVVSKFAVPKDEKVIFRGFLDGISHL